MHELIYPLLQGYDSVMLRSDLTIIGSDQLFNELLGRFYQERFGQPPQVVLTTKITPGIDGKAKQSKSLDNYIGLGHSPRDKFGRAMRLPDALIGEYLRVYTALPLEEVAEIEARVPADPMSYKLRLAREIVARYHGPAVAEAERAWFVATFSARQVPTEVPELWVDTDAAQTGLALVRQFFAGRKSNSELRRLFTQGGISCNGEPLRDGEAPLEIRDGDLFRVGKRTWFRARRG
jgi:tyrosyl-tRNA synthetase